MQKNLLENFALRKWILLVEIHLKFLEQIIKFDFRIIFFKFLRQLPSDCSIADIKRKNNLILI